QKIKQLIDEYDVEKVVIGLPVSLAGELGPQAKAVLEYVEKLRATVKVPVATWDERLTTASAKRMLLESEVRRSRRKEVIDKIAAAIMLQSYLDAKRSGE
ncbi:MAG: Holliday junction resolvase RuvX, partial [Firmicutes bacterium]|nr:Holliday junction resolvase RuvX [Bacillota bacterium]